VSHVGRAYSDLISDQWHSFLFWLSSIF
jgi:hypothetical protein